MFIGHFGVGFASKKIDERPSLGTMFIAAQFLDLLWPVLIIFGIEKVQIVPDNPAFKTLDFISYPYSHSLFLTLIWSMLFGLVYYSVKKNLKGSILLGALVLSHWILDLFTHVPDLPIFPWSDVKVGLGLWNSVPATIIIEGAIFAIGVYLYAKCTEAQNKKGSIGLWILAAFLVAVYLMSTFGSPPPSSDAIGYTGLSMWLIVAWGYWIDRNRKSTSAAVE